MKYGGRGRFWAKMKKCKKNTIFRAKILLLSINFVFFAKRLKSIYEDLCADCLKNPCECDAENLEMCPWCGKPYEYDVIFGKCECKNLEDRFCDKCGQRLPEDGDCNCNNDPSMECPDCHKQFCTCNPCPLCGDITCNGDCGRDTTEQNLCEYCGRECGGTCEAFCPICHRTNCTEHK